MGTNAHPLEENVMSEPEPSQKFYSQKIGERSSGTKDGRRRKRKKKMLSSGLLGDA